MPRPRKLKRKGAHLDMYEGIWNSNRSVAMIPISVTRMNTACSWAKLTSAENYHVAPNDNALAVAKVNPGSNICRIVEVRNFLQANWKELSNT